MFINASIFYWAATMKRQELLMYQCLRTLAIITVFAVFPPVAMLAAADRFERDDPNGSGLTVQLGPRPFYLIEKMAPGKLKTTLQQCADQTVFHQTDFSIGHCGGVTLQFPEHTRESYVAAARMGAGVVECDVTFTKDKQLVCRHAQNDLHTTTNILATPLAATCIKPFTPAVLGANGAVVTPASA